MECSNGVKIRNNDFEVKWEEKSREMIYNNHTKVLNVGNMCATNYKYDKYVGLPLNKSPEIETSHQSLGLSFSGFLVGLRMTQSLKNPDQNPIFPRMSLTVLKASKNRSVMALLSLLILIRGKDLLF